MAAKKKAEETPEEEVNGEEVVPETTNGAPAEASIQEQVEDKTDEIAATYERAKHELNEAVTKLRHEISQLDVEKARQQARTWVEENPTLTVLLALGAGIVVGKVMSEALKPAPPPPLSQRLKRQGQEAVTQARRYAHDVGDVVSERAMEVGDEIVRRARELGEDVSRRAREMGEDVTRRAANVVATATERSADVHDSLSGHSDEVAKALHHAVEDLAGTVQRKAGHSRDVFESLFKATKSVAAAVVVKKVTDWLRRTR